MAQRLVTTLDSHDLILRPQLRDAERYVELTPLSNCVLVRPTVADVLGLNIGGEILTQSIACVALGTNLLSVLGNCDRIVSAAADLVEAFVILCPRMAILATSRQLLGLNGEYAYQVSPLTVAATDDEEPDYIQGRGGVELAIAIVADFWAAAGLTPEAREWPGEAPAQIGLFE